MIGTKLIEIPAPTTYEEAVEVGMAVGDVITDLAYTIDPDLMDTGSEAFDFAVAVCMDIIYINTMQRGAYA